MDSNETIDVTDLVESMRTTFVSWATAYIYSEEIVTPGFEWAALPVLSSIDRAVIEAVLNKLSTSAVMQAFFANTAIKKASQANDYLAAVDATYSLPPTATDDEYEKAEQTEISAFNAFVSLTS